MIEYVIKVVKGQTRDWFLERKMPMKKLLSILLVSIMLLGLTACGSEETSTGSAADQTVEKETTTAKKTTEAEKTTEESRTATARNNKDTKDDSSSSKTEVADNDLLKDGDFTDGIPDGYNSYFDGGDGDVSWENGEAVIHVTDWGNKPYSVQLNRNGFDLKEGNEYRLIFDVHSSISRSIEVCVQKEGGDWDVLFENDKNIGTVSRHQELDFTAPSSVPAQISFNVGLVGDPADVYEEHWVYLDNIQLLDMGKASQSSSNTGTRKLQSTTEEAKELSAWEEFSWDTRRYRGYSVDLTNVRDGNVDVWFGDAEFVDLTDDGEATLVWKDGSKDFLDKNVLIVFTVAYGNGGNGAIFMVLEDGSVDLVNPSAMIRHEVRMTYNLAGLKEIKMISRGTSGDNLGMIVARDINGKEYILDGYITTD